VYLFVTSTVLLVIVSFYSIACKVGFVVSCVCATFILDNMILYVKRDAHIQSLS